MVNAFRAEHRWVTKADAPNLLKKYRLLAKNDKYNFTAIFLFAETLL